MNFVRRVAKLERLMVPRRLPRIVLRYEGPGSERFPQPTQEELDEAWFVLSMQFVPAKHGRPVELNAARGPEQVQMSSDVLR